MRILCLDVGQKTIGVALSDPLGWTAQGIDTIRRGALAEDCREIGRLVKEFEVEQIVVGLPLQMDGAEGKQAERTRDFVEKIRPAVDHVPILFWDERLSTAAAERGLLEADLSRAKRKKVIDKMAAAFILQGYLDSHRNES